LKYPNAEPLARELIEELSLDRLAAEPEPAERGGRLSVRQYLRDSDRPFLVREEESQTPPVLAMRVVVDHSTSMNHRQGGRMRIESVAEGAMTLHLACEALRIDHRIAVTPQQTVLAERGSGERGKALIAGMVPAQTGWEDIAVAIQRRSEELLRSGADIRLLLVLHDGYPNDGPDAKKLCQSLRGKVEVIGVLLDPDDGTQRAMGEIFGQDRLVACQSAQLPRKLAAMLRSIRGV
jgi:nitric oxide reductase activation protein